MRHFDALKFAAVFLLANGHADATGHADANEALSFGRQLEHIIAKTYDIQYVKSKFRTFVPVNNEVSNGVNTLTYRQYDVTGAAVFLDEASKAFPRIGISGAEFTSGFYSMGDSYGYNLQEWRNSQVTGLPMSAMKAEAARNAIERLMDTVACTGDTNRNITGLANAPNVPVKTINVTAGFSTVAWLPSGGGTATPLQIFQDVAALSKSVFDITKGLYEVDTLLLPTKLYSYLNSTLFQPQYNTVTLLQALISANPWIKHVDYWQRLDTAGADGKGRIIAYKRDPNVCEFFISQEFESMPPEVHGMDFTINCHARVGSVQVRYPLAMVYLDGAGGTDF